MNKLTNACMDKMDRIVRRSNMKQNKKLVKAKNLIAFALWANNCHMIFAKKTFTFGAPR